MFNSYSNKNYSFINWRGVPHLGLTFFLFGASASVAFSSSLPNRILVKTKNMPMISVAEAQDIRHLGAIQWVKTIGTETHLLRFSTDMEPQVASQFLMQSGFVEWAQPDYVFSLPYFEEKEVISEFWTLSPIKNTLNIFDPLDEFKNDNPAVQDPPLLPNPGLLDPQLKEAWGLSKIKADQIWSQQAGSKEIIVADIDTGVDYNHPDLINNMWRNPNPTMNDIVGYDFVNEDAFPFDDFNHGTHTSGTIGATGKNGIGISGVSQRVSIMALKFLGGSEGQGSTSDAVECIDYAIKNGARIINASWGGYVGPEDIENKILIEAIERVEKANVLFVAAAGNDGRDIGVNLMLPGGIKNSVVLTVASTNEREKRSFFSNYSNDRVHVAAPGSNILSTVPGGQYQKFSGTSMAAPHVAGLAAIILAERPDLSAVAVREIIESTVDPLDTLKGRIKTGGRINAKLALERARSFGL
jgi:subtilisin family serine protease